MAEDPIIPTCKRFVLALLATAVPVTSLNAATSTVALGDRLTTYVQARTADAVGDEGRAARLFASLAASSPTDKDLSRRAIATAINAGDVDLALKGARSAPAGSLGLDARLLLVADLLRRDKAVDALKMVESRPSDEGGGFVAPLLRAWTEQLAGGDGSARLAAIKDDSFVAPFAQEQQAAMLLATGKIDIAMPIVTKALAAAGGRETRLRLGYAALLIKAGATDRARTILAGQEPALSLLDLRRPQPGIAIDTPAAGFSEMLLAVAVGLSQNNQRGFPLTLAQIAHHAAPDNSEAAILLGLMLAREERFTQAIEVLKAVPEKDPFIAEALDLRVRSLLALDRDADALSLAEKAARKRPNSAADQARLGNVLGDMDRHQEAADAFGRAAAADARRGAANRWRWHLLRAAQLDETDRWPEAKAELRAGLAAAPDQPLLLNYLGYGSLERGENLDEAEKMIRQALALRPDDPSITDSLGWALYKRGRYQEAVDTLRKAAAGDGAEAEIHEHLGDALFRIGRRVEARFAWRAALLTAEKEESARLQAKIDSGWSEATAAP